MKLITEEFIRGSAVIAAGVLLYSIALVVDNSNERPIVSTSSERFSQTLSNKKVCILKSWNNPGLERFYSECAKYNETGRTNQTRLASTTR